MSRLTKEYFDMMGVEVLDRAFDADGILYSGVVPKPDSKVGDLELPTQRPLTQLEQRVRERWRARKDPINWLNWECEYANISR